MATASDSGNGNCFSCTKPWQKSNNICGLNPENTITSVAMRGELAEDIIAVGSDQMGSITTVRHFLFSCAPTSLLQGLSNGVKGILGLGRSRIALPSQLATTLGFHRKFAVCLSSSAGVILTGDGHSTGTDIFKSLTYTPLITNQAGTLEQYYINVKSIKINGKRLSLNTSLLSMDQKGYGGTKISTVVPYTTLESTIYDTFVKAYSKTATSMNMTRVAPVAPFRVCFSTEGLDTTPVGPTVPTIDLVLQSEMVKWRIYGRNSMVKVSNEVMCLGFLDGGLNSRNSIVIGGYQLEDNLLEFNLVYQLTTEALTFFLRPILSVPFSYSMIFLYLQYDIFEI
ncbi:hypothetical protein F0562_000276 [Nyssa sinensis]|uniref:Peptidase A1 domain-containing protein n=1 Tax=Nyssa sinensis TaxID=561372 RepID=A0A5J5C3V7_9ASTE|nr:hypothetical protein F0562_000276 [Nyssa sinensis]